MRERAKQEINAIIPYIFTYMYIYVNKSVFQHCIQYTIKAVLLRFSLDLHSRVCWAIGNATAAQTRNTVNKAITNLFD